MGQAGMLDTARFKHFVAEHLGVSPSAVEAITLGSHGDTMVPVPSLVTVDGRPLAELVDEATIDDLVRRTRDGGAEIVALLVTGSAYYAPAAAAEAMVRAVADRHRRGHAGGGLGRRPVRHRRRLPGRSGPPRAGRVCGRWSSCPSPTGELAALRTAADAVRSRQADVAALARPGPE